MAKQDRTAPRQNYKSGIETKMPVPDDRMSSVPVDDGRKIDVRGSVTDSVVSDQSEEETEEKEIEVKLDNQDVPITNKNQIERALLHLSFLEQEIAQLVDDRSKVVGPMRRTAAQMRQQFDGPISQWPPIKTVREILLAVQSQVKD